jgi:hypothetical protein
MLIILTISQHSPSRWVKLILGIDKGGSDGSAIIFSLRKWQSTYICFVLMKNLIGGEGQSWMPSHTSFIIPISQKWSSYSKCFNYKNSHVGCVIAWYSTSVLSWATTIFFLCFHDIKFPPMKTQKLDCLSLTPLAELTFGYQWYQALPL